VSVGGVISPADSKAFTVSGLLTLALIIGCKISMVVHKSQDKHGALVFNWAACVFYCSFGFPMLLDFAFFFSSPCLCSLADMCYDCQHVCSLPSFCIM